MNEGLKKNESWIEIIGFWSLLTSVVCGYYGHFRPVLEWKTDDAAISCSMYFPKTWFSDLKHSFANVRKLLTSLPQANIFILDWFHSLTQIFHGILQFFLWFSIWISLWNNVAFALTRNWTRIKTMKVSHKSKYYCLFFSLLQTECFDPKLFRCYIYNIPLFETSLLLHYDTRTWICDMT